jgi:transcriptional regulator with XRE-family HTH domain
MLIDGNTLRKIREVYRLSRDEMGALLGVSGRFIHYVERGERNLPRERAEMLADELALTPEKLARILAIHDEMKSSARLSVIRQHLARVAVG